MRYSWSESKRRRNLRDHGLDLADSPVVFAGVTYTFEDDRLEYPERRYVTLGLLRGVPVSIVHTETGDEIRIISFRKTTRREITIYFESI